MTDYFSFKEIFALLLVFFFETLTLLQGISYYKTGKLFATFGVPGSDSADVIIAVISFVFGSILFIFFNMMLLGALLTHSITDIILFSIPDLGLYLILRRYWKRLEANQKKE